MLATAADMTESKRADEALRERERFIRTIIDSMPALIACVGPDERYRFNNKAYETWFGRSLTSLRGRRVQEVVGEATYSEIRHHIQAALSGRAVHFECLVPHGKNGDMRHLSVNYVPDITRDGSVKGFFDLMIDITERRRAKEALQASEGRYRSLYTKTPAMLHSIDPSGRLVEVSERWLEVLGYERSDVLGRKTTEFLTEESRRYAETVTLPQFFKTGYAQDVAYQFVKQSGEIIDILLSAIVERDGEGRILRSLAVLTNVTVRRRAEEALRTSHEQLQVLSRRLIDIQEMERGRIARELHDEIGQALTAVKLNLQRIQRTSAKSSVSRSVSEGIMIVDSAVDEVRNLALDLRPSLLDDLGLVAALRWYTSRQAERAGIEVTFSADSLTMRPPSDVETACFRVAQEAFTNVVRHAKARGVTVALRWRDEHLELTVGDDGSGFDADAARDWLSTDAHMGLVGMEERVLLIGGSFSIESTPDQGTLVRALFPLRPDRPAAARPGDPVSRLKADH